MTTVDKILRLFSAEGERPGAGATLDRAADRHNATGPGQTGPTEAATAVQVGPSPAPGTDQEAWSAARATGTQGTSRPIELRHRVAATLALMAIGVGFGGLMLARGHVATGVMLLLVLAVLPPLVLLVMPALVDHARRGQPH